MHIQRLRLWTVWLVVACAWPVMAATGDPRVEDRQMLQPGIWWDPAHAGHGFELQQIGQQVYVLWYTYDRDGNAVWYAGQGVGDGVSVSVELVRHHWDGERIDTHRPVGSLRLEFAHREQASAHWTLESASGEWSLRPYEVNGTLPEVNHSGLWYQPERPGYGLSLMVQGDVRIGALYFYDEQGEPTWMFGHTEDGGTRIPLQAFVGPCPGCAPANLITAPPSTSLQLSLGSESELAFQVSGAPVSDPPWPAQGAALRQIAPSFSARAADWQLARFSQDPQLKRWLELANEGRQRYLPSVDYSPAPPARSFSPTNLQEAGVDEAGRVKTDGDWIYTWAADTLGNALPRLRVARVTDTGLQVQSPVPLSISAQRLDHPGLYLTEQHLVAVASSVPRSAGTSSVWVDQRAWANGSTRIEVLDRSQPAAPTPVWKAEIEGHLLASRRIDDQLYVVTRSSVLVPDLRVPATTEADRAYNRAVFERTALAAMLPQVRWNGQPAEPLVSADRIYLPPESAAGRQPEFISIIRIDLRQPQQRETLAILGQASAVYVSNQHLYVAGNRFGYEFFTFNGWWIPGYAKTDIHQIALGETGMQVKGTGTVEGYLDRDADRAPLRFSERDGHLHVVTVSPGMWGSLGRNRLTVLAPSRVQPGLLATRAILPSKARPQPLGKPGEMLYATRYVDDRLYAVTFQTTDPLYSVDLSNPADPYIRGALEIPGFSDYLHPLPNGLLLGLGMDATDAGGFAWFQGLQLSLYDVNGDTPRELQRVLVGKRGSGTAALRHHHGFADLVVPGGRLIALPARIHDVDASVPAHPPSSYLYPHAWSGVLRFGLTGSGAADARLHSLPPLISRPKEPSSLLYNPDDAALNGRPVLFEHGMLYVDRGQFYWMDRNGVQSGPF